jgi:hypothetical protein
MMTKTGTDLKKEASLSLAAGLHVAQNILLKNKMRSPKLTAHLSERFRQGLANKAGRITSGDIGTAGARGFVPEIGLFDDHINKAGKEIRQALLKHKIDPTRLSPAEMDIIGEALQGNFTKIVPHARIAGAVKGKEDLSVDVITASLKSVIPEMSSQDSFRIAKAVRYGISNGGKDFLQDLEAAWKSTDLTHKMIGGVGAAIRKNKAQPNKYLPAENKVMQNAFRRGNLKAREQLQEGSAKSRKVLGTTGETAGLATIASIDPVTGGFNLLKRLSMSDSVANKVPLVKKLQKKVTDVTLTNPVRKNFMAGLDGQKQRFAGPKKFMTDYGLNPVTSDMHALSRRMGELSRKHRLGLESVYAKNPSNNPVNAN